MRLWELATRSSYALRLRQAAMPAMERLQERIREHTQLAILEQDEALFIERLSSPSAAASVARIAGRLPAHASSSGLLLLAFSDRDTRARILSQPLAALTSSTLVDPTAVRRKLDEIRTLGHAIAPGYLDEAATGIAVPLRDDTGAVIAALSAVIPRDAHTEGTLVELHSSAKDTEKMLRDPHPGA